MVGPASGEWYVLRATDGERFVALYKDVIFGAICWLQEQKDGCKAPDLVIEILLHAIIYPLAIELFAFQNGRC